MVGKERWFFLPYLVAKELPGLMMIPTVVKEERYHQPRRLGDYSYSKLNPKTLPISALSSMQYDRVLDRLIREVIISNPALGPMHTLKSDVSDGFYRIGLHPTYAPKLGLVIPSEGENEDLVVIPLTLPMGWKNLPPIFCTAAETLADIANEALSYNTPTLLNSLDEMAEAIVREYLPTPQPELSELTREPYLRWTNANTSTYVDAFVDNFLGLPQGPAHQRRQVRQTLFHSLEKVFRPCDSGESANHKEVLSLKNLREENCTLST